MGPVVLALAVLAYVVVGRAAGLTWKTLLHWAGETLLIAGILLAAKGIGDVRREWTGLPGIAARSRRAARATQGRANSLMWACWNKIANSGWLAQRLRLRPHSTQVTSSGAFALPGLATTGGSVAREVNREPAPADGTVGQRLAWLEGRMATAYGAIDSHYMRHEHEAKERQAAADQEHESRVAEDQGIRDSIASLAGGGLRLQAWGVACLLAGTIMTAIW